MRCNLCRTLKLDDVFRLFLFIEKNSSPILNGNAPGEAKEYGKAIFCVNCYACERVYVAPPLLIRWKDPNYL